MRRGFIWETSFHWQSHSIYDAIKNALAVKSERKELIHDIHDGIQVQAALRWVAVRCFVALVLATGL